MMEDALELMDCARRSGLDIQMDSGMFTQWAAPIGSASFSKEVLDACGWTFEDLLIASEKYKGKRLTPELYAELRRERPKEWR